MVSGEALAKELGWHEPTLVDLELGRVDATQEQLQAMLDAISRIVARRQQEGK